MALLSLENAQSVDLLVYVGGLVLYILLVWMPCVVSYFLVKTYEPVSMTEFSVHWWKFKRQYIYLEIWFRTHVLLGGSATIILFLEPWGWLERVGFIFVIALVCVCLGYVAKLVHARIPGSYALKTEISTHMRGVHKTSRGDMHQWMARNAVVNDKPMIHTKDSRNDANYVSTASQTETTMQKQIEMASPHAGTPDPSRKP